MELLSYGLSEDMKIMQQDRVGWQQHEVKDVQPLQFLTKKKKDLVTVKTLRSLEQVSTEIKSHRLNNFCLCSDICASQDGEGGQCHYPAQLHGQLGSFRPHRIPGLSESSTLRLL